MAIISDDCDIADVRLFMNAGHNGDYYINLLEFNTKGECINKMDFRMAFSGSKIPSNVKLAFKSLFNEMEKSKLNFHPKNENAKI